MQGTILKSPIDLKDFVIDFGPEKGETMYRSYLYRFTNREAGIVLGYNARRAHPPTMENEKRGRYMAFRFKTMCESLGINPHDVGYDFKVLSRCRRGWTEVEKPVKDAVWKVICDKHDNQS